VGSLSQRIVEILCHVHNLATLSAMSLHAWVQQHLSSIFSQAHDLSLKIKRDILSVSMRVVIAEEERFDPLQHAPGWEGMGTKAGDRIFGKYSLGLHKVTEHGMRTIPAKPAVITAALLRHIFPHYVGTHTARDCSKRFDAYHLPES
jgi:hypothetical protein